MPDPTDGAESMNRFSTSQGGRGASTPSEPLGESPPGLPSTPEELTTATQAIERPSIAIVNSSSRFGGITLSAVSLYDALRSSGFPVTWYQCVDGGRERFTPDGGVVVSGAGIRIESLELGVNRLWTFPRRLQWIPEDIVLLADPTLTYVARYHRRSIVLVYDLLPLSHYADRLDSRWMFRYVIPKLRTMTRVIVPTTTLRDELVRRGVDPRRIRMVRLSHSLGEHPDHVDRSVERVHRTRELRVLYVATDRPWKNIDFVLRLAKAMESVSSGTHFTFTLLSQLMPSTRQRFEDLKLTNVRIIERLPSIASLYDESDVLVYPSLYEGFGRPLIEAQAFGLPIVANRIQPFIELLGDAGILLSVDSLDAWIATLTSLADPDTLRAHAQRSLELSRSYAPERYRESVLEAFDRLPAGRWR
ncbi:MAG: glycosyltransferase family 4 protein [Thermoplasmata archaeon]